MAVGQPNASVAGRIYQDRLHDLVTGLASDGYPQRFKQDLKPVVQVYAVGNAARGSGRALVVFAIEGSRLTPEKLPDGGVAYRLNIRIIGSNARGEVSRLDTVRVFRSAKPLAASAYLSGISEIPLGAGHWDVRMLVSDQDGKLAGGGAGRLDVRVPAGKALGVSDVVLGIEGSAFGWNGSYGMVPINALDAYRSGDRVEAYYEVSGMTPGAEYRTTLRILPLGRSAVEPVSLSFVDVATKESESFRRSIDARNLAEGQYRLEVTVGDARSGASVRQERLINVVK